MNEVQTEERRQIDLQDRTHVRNFVLAGNSYFTLQSTKTGKHYTYRVSEADGSDGQRHFVSVAVEGYDRMVYQGMVFNRTRFSLTRGSKFSAEAPSVRAFQYFWDGLLQGREMPSLEFWHEGRCGRCGRMLTDPESIERGIGPVCLEQMLGIR